MRLDSRRRTLHRPTPAARDRRPGRGGAHPRGGPRGARGDRRDVPLEPCARRARGSRRDRGPQDHGGTHPRERGGGGPGLRAALVHPWRAGAGVRPAGRRRARLSVLGRLRHQGAGGRRHRAAERQAGRVRRRARRRGSRQPLGDFGARVRAGHARGEPRAARVRRLHARLSQAQHRRQHQGRIRGAAADPHGRGRRGREQGAQGPPDLLGHPLHREPAPHGTVRHGTGVRARRGGHPDDALPDADPRRDQPGHAGRDGRRRAPPRSSRP